MSQYDDIASSYSKDVTERSDRAHVLVPTAQAYLGDLSGLRVLDLACGDGHFTRHIRAWGAAEVVGVDISAEMIALARKASPEISFHVGDVAKLEKLGEFDVVFAAFLLHYSPNVEALRAMCRAIRRNLKPDGRFLSFNENPFHPLSGKVLYDFEVVPHGPIEDGVGITNWIYRDGKRFLSFSHRHYEPETYESALKAAGFSSVQWKPFLKGEHADAGFPPGYWDAFLEDYCIRVLDCR